MQIPTKTIVKNTKAIILGIIVAISASYAFAYFGPAGTAPNNNLAPLLHIDGTEEAKGGAAVTGSLFEVHGRLTADKLHVWGASFLDDDARIGLASATGDMYLKDLGDIVSAPAAICANDYGKVVLCTPTLTLVANPTLLVTGNSSTLTWESHNTLASSCQSSYIPVSGNTQPSVNQWNAASKALSGSQVINFNYAQGDIYIFTITCGSLSATATVIVVPVSNPPPHGSVRWDREGYVFGGNANGPQSIMPLSHPACPGCTDHTFVVPSGVTQITIFAWGAGGPGSAGGARWCPGIGCLSNNTTAGGGGGAGSGGEYYTTIVTGLQSGQVYTIDVGDGGTGGEPATCNGCDGGYGTTGSSGVDYGPYTDGHTHISCAGNCASALTNLIVRSGARGDHGYGATNNVYGLPGAGGILSGGTPNSCNRGDAGSGGLKGDNASGGVASNGFVIQTFGTNSYGTCVTNPTPNHPLVGVGGSGGDTYQAQGNYYSGAYASAGHPGEVTITW